MWLIGDSYKCMSNSVNTRCSVNLSGSGILLLARKYRRFISVKIFKHSLSKYWNLKRWSGYSIDFGHVFHCPLFSRFNPIQATMRWYSAKLNPNTLRHDALYQMVYFMKYIPFHFVIPVQLCLLYCTDVESIQIRILNIASWIFHM